MNNLIIIAKINIQRMLQYGEMSLPFSFGEEYASILCT